LGAIRTIPELVFMIRFNGFEGSVCDPSYFYGPTGIWAYLFTISKLYELGDTAFIILRKQPLIFLHWYHHVTVFIYVWFSYTDHTAPGRWFMVMNFTVHSFMYTYYALRAMKFRLHKFVNMFITSLQIAQMLMGVVVIIKAYEYKSQGHYCQMSWENMRYCSIMYISYLVLFAYFFYNAYLKPKASTVKRESAEKLVNHVNGSATKIDAILVNGNANKFNGNIMMNGDAKKLD
jgi:elongation of very long chain fatty acids protein 6